MRNAAAANAEYDPGICGIGRDYPDNISVAGDLAILLRTPAAIGRSEGAH